MTTVNPSGRRCLDLFPAQFQVSSCCNINLKTGNEEVPATAEFVASLSGPIIDALIVKPKGLPPGKSEAATTPLVYRFFHQGFWIYRAGTTLFGHLDTNT